MDRLTLKYLCLVGGCCLSISAQAQLSFPSFQATNFGAGAHQLTLNGNAAFSQPNLRLTKDGSGYTSGSGFYNTKQVTNRDFVTEFRYNIPGGDGIAFLIQNNAAGTKMLGSFGGYLGYMGMSHTLAVEFDNYLNGSTDTVGVSVRSGATAGFGGGFASAAATVKGTHNVRISYVAGTLSVFLDNFSTPLVKLPNFNLTDYEDSNGQSYVGFSGGEALVHGDQVVENWTFADTPLAWGAAVDVTLTGSTNPISSRLVSFDGTSVVLASDVTVSTNGTISTSRSYPLSQVKQIVLTTPGVPEIDEFNQYIVDQLVGGTRSVRTFELDGYRNGLGWTLAQHYFSKDSSGKYVQMVGTQTTGPVTSLHAIFRQIGRSYNTTTEVKPLLNQEGYSVGIPPHILYGLAYQESGVNHRWQQYRSADNWTVVTWDGGIGLMQLTQGAALEDSKPASVDVLTHLYRLSSDIGYNIQAGATKLSKSKQHRPNIGTAPDTALEAWYYALWDYNGWSLSNNPNNPNHDPNPYPYQQQVIDHITNGRGLWTPVAMSAPANVDIGNGLPSVSLGYVPMSAHVDVKFAGSVAEVKPAFVATAKFKSGAPKGETDVVVTLTNQTTLPGVGGVAIGNAYLATANLILPNGTKLKQFSVTPSSQTFAAKGVITVTLKYTNSSTVTTMEYQFACTKCVGNLTQLTISK